MNNKEGFIRKLKSILGQSDSKKPSKSQYFILVLVLGVAFMLVSNLFTSGEEQANNILPVTSTSKEESAEVFKQSKGGSTGSISDYEAEYENQLKEALETISGIGTVSVVVNVESAGEKVVEKNRVTGNQVTKE